MKTIVICGASSGVGKTTLARSLRAVLLDAEWVKIGHGKPKADVGNRLYPLGTSMETLCANHSDAAWLLIESNSILYDAEPDLVIYLDGANPKLSAGYARTRAHIISGQYVAAEEITHLAKRLGLSVDMVESIVRLSGAHL